MSKLILKHYIPNWQNDYIYKYANDVTHMIMIFGIGRLSTITMRSNFKSQWGVSLHLANSRDTSFCAFIQHTPFCRVVCLKNWATFLHQWCEGVIQFLKQNTIKCLHNAVQYNMILHTSLQWLGQNTYFCWDLDTDHNGDNDTRVWW